MGHEARGHPPGGPCPVRDRVLLGRRPEAQRPSARRLRGRFEDRVVAESAGPARRDRDPARDRCRAPGRRPGRRADRPDRAGPGPGRRRSGPRGAPAGARRARPGACGCCRRRSRPRRHSAGCGRRARHRAHPPRCRNRRRGSAGRSRAPRTVPSARRWPRTSRRPRPGRRGCPARRARRARRGRDGAARGARAACGSSGSRRAAEAARSPDGSPLDGGEDRGLRLEQAGQAGVGQVDERVRGGPVERLALGRALELDIRPVIGADDVEVDVGARVLRVVEVEQRRAIDDARPRRPRPCRRGAGPCRR